MKLLTFFLSVFLSFSLLGSPFTLIEDQSGLTIVTPSLAERKTCKMRLESGLSCYLISDPQTPKSGAALAVKAGSWDDPINRPGLAHFVEHMLFLGTEKYPNEGEYHRFLDAHGGNHNACTLADRTAYFFSVDNAGFDGALDRFAQFFISPLFNPSGIAREREAVNQEYCKNLFQDYWRALFVQKELANANHPFHNFCIGNRETLADTSQEELQTWYRAHYRASDMVLVIYASSPLEELQEKVVTYFSAIPNNESSPASEELPLLSSETAGKMVVISPRQQIQKLEMTWELPPLLGNDKDAQADTLVGYVLGHEGSSSLLALLKEQRLAEALSCGKIPAGREQSIFSLSINLTPQGVQEYEKVIEHAFIALSSLRQSSIPEYIFDEVRRRKELEYTYQGREDIFKLVGELVLSALDEPLETFPKKNLMPTVFDKAKIDQLLSLFTPENCHFTLIASPSSAQKKMTRKERWMQTPYGLFSIAEKKLRSWAALSITGSSLLPAPNRFLPENLSLVEGGKERAPKLLYSSDRGTLYHKTDGHYLVPEISNTFLLNTPEITDVRPESHAQADLFCHAFTQKLGPCLYEAREGGLDFSLETSHNGLKLTLSGFSEKAPALFETLLVELQNCLPSREEFSLYKEALKREYNNRKENTPIVEATELLKSLLYKDYPTLQQKEESLCFLSYDNFIIFCKQIWKSCHIEATAYGNILDQEATALFEKAEKAFSESAIYPPPLQPKKQLASFPGKKDPAIISQKSSLPGNVLLLAIDCGDFSHKKREALEILSKGLEEPFFTELRTRQQTGYIVKNWSSEIERHLYAFFLVQSSAYDTRDLLARFELFVESCLKDLQSGCITEERFSELREAQILSLENPADTLSEMGHLLHTLAYEYEGDFDWYSARIQGLKELNYEEFQAYAKEFLGKENHGRLAICINGNLPAKERFRYRHLNSIEKLRKEITYREKPR